MQYSEGSATAAHKSNSLCLSINDSSVITLGSNMWSVFYIYRSSKALAAEELMGNIL